MRRHGKSRAFSLNHASNRRTSLTFGWLVFSFLFSVQAPYSTLNIEYWQTPLNPLTSHTCKLTDAQAGALQAYLRENNYKFREVPYARFAAEKEKTNLVFYESGKLVVQGKGTQDFVEFILEPQILQEVKQLALEVRFPFHRRSSNVLLGALRLFK